VSRCGTRFRVSRRSGQTATSLPVGGTKVSRFGDDLLRGGACTREVARGAPELFGWGRSPRSSGRNARPVKALRRLCQREEPSRANAQEAFAGAVYLAVVYISNIVDLARRWFLLALSEVLVKPNLIDWEGQIHVAKGSLDSPCFGSSNAGSVLRGGLVRLRVRRTAAAPFGLSSIPRARLRSPGRSLTAATSSSTPAAPASAHIGPQPSVDFEGEPLRAVKAAPRSARARVKV